MYRFLLLVLLCIWSVNQTEATCLKYNRKDYRHWIDEDRDCQNTRNEVLIQESLESVTYKSSKGCKVSSGKWYGVNSRDKCISDDFFSINASELAKDLIGGFKSQAFPGS